MSADHSHAHGPRPRRRARSTSTSRAPASTSGIFAALICLTIATVKVSYYDFGSANIVIAIAHRDDEGVARRRVLHAPAARQAVQHAGVPRGVPLPRRSSSCSRTTTSASARTTRQRLRQKVDPARRGRGARRRAGDVARRRTTSAGEAPGNGRRRAAAGREEGVGAGGGERARRRARRRRAGAASASAGCKRKHVPVDAVPELGYPACGDAGATSRDASWRRGACAPGRSRPRRTSSSASTLRRTACGYTFRSRQEWPLAIADVEVHYDASFTPIWAWKRMTIAGSKRADGNADIRRYELRTGEVFIKRRDAKGVVTLREAPARAGACPCPPGAQRRARSWGRGAGSSRRGCSARSCRSGGKTQELVLDFRDMVESLEEGTLERNADLLRADARQDGARLHVLRQGDRLRRRRPTSSSATSRACARATR